MGQIKTTWESIRESKKKENDNDDKNAKKKENVGKVYDHKSKTFDLRNLKATDLKNNKRVIVVMNNDDEKEITRNNVMLELKKVFNNYTNKHCDRFGNLK